MVAGPNTVFVLYKVSNHKDDQCSSSYNAFQVERNRFGGLTLAEIKQHCAGLNKLSGPSGGADAYHWRVRMDDKQGPNSNPSGSTGSFKWWDIKDESSRLPIKENVSLSELETLFDPTSRADIASSNSNADERNPSPSGGAGPGRQIAGAARGFGKMIKNAAREIDEAINSVPDPNEPRVSVIAFKLLDLAKISQQYSSGGASTAPAAPIPRRRPQNPPRRPQAEQANAAPIPSADNHRNFNNTRPSATVNQQRPIPRGVVPPPRSAGNLRQTSNVSAASSSASSLLDFSAAPAAPSSTGHAMFSGAGSASGLHNLSAAPKPTRMESKEEKLKREYKEKAAQQNRVWDEVDQRWVVVDPSGNNSSRQTSSSSAPPGSSHTPSTTNNNIKGISLDNVNTAGKSASVAAAVNERVEDMRAAQAKAKQELKEREEKKKEAENEEDAVRKKLEPKVKAWSEEHGQKKKLSALLSSMHTILWDGANWKQVSLGDILDEKKLRRCYLKATLVVHPDKTCDLDAEQRFLAKRIFDALTQAHAEHMAK